MARVAEKTGLRILAFLHVAHDARPKGGQALMFQKVFVEDDIQELCGGFDVWSESLITVGTGLLATQAVISTAADGIVETTPPREATIKNLIEFGQLTFDG